jgi:hypothetical protein
MGGQFILVIPDKDIVFVTTANTMMYKDGHQMVLDSFWENIYPYIYEETIAQDTESYGQLETMLDKLTLTLPIGKACSMIEKSISDKTIELEENQYGYKNLKFVFDQDYSKLEFEKENKVYAIHFGMRKWIKGEEPFRGFECVAAGTWVDNKTLVIHIQTYIEVQMFILTCRFEKDCIVIHILPAGGMKTEDIEGYINTKSN